MATLYIAPERQNYERGCFALSGPTMWSSWPPTARDPSPTLTQFQTDFIKLYLWWHESVFILLLEGPKTNADSVTVLTEWQAIGACWLKNVGDDGHHAEDETRQDKFHDVIERFATKVNSYDNANVWRLTTVVPVLCHSHRNLCATVKNIAQTKLLRTYHMTWSKLSLASSSSSSSSLLEIVRQPTIHTKLGLWLWVRTSEISRNFQKFPSEKLSWNFLKFILIFPKIFRNLLNNF